MAQMRSLVTRAHLNALYQNRVRQTSGPGNDGITSRKFDKILDNEFRVIRRKMLSGDYTFTPYKQRLFSKGPGKPPRIVSIPTIRDKIALGILRELVQDAFSRRYGRLRSVQQIVATIKDTLDVGVLEHFVRLDVKNFYASIDHMLLERKLRGLLGRQPKVVEMILRAIRTPTVPYGVKAKQDNDRGVPEGLPLSNILANLYLAELDKELAAQTDLRHVRYVDDILVFCRKDQAEQVTNMVTQRLEELGLTINSEKVESDVINTEGFTYLGYHFNDRRISVSDRSVRKLERSLERLFAENAHKKTAALEWKVNLRITGCKYLGRRFGWLLFFSQMDDVSLLYRLDWLVSRLAKRYRVSTGSFRRFVRAYHEITKNASQTTYIPDFDSYTVAQKRDIVESVTEYRGKKLDDETVARNFEQIVAAETKELERDLQIPS